MRDDKTKQNKRMHTYTCTTLQTNKQKQTCTQQDNNEKDNEQCRIRYV